MKLSNRAFIVLCVAGIAVAAVIVSTANFGRSTRTDDMLASDLDDRKLPVPVKNSQREGWKEIGGILRPASDLAEPQKVPDEVIRPASNVGQSPKLPIDLNENTKSIAEAIATGNFPERLSAFIEPAPFDKEKFLADPKAYLDIVEPGRVFQVMAKGDGVRPIGETGPQYYELLRDETAVLKATADPGMPVTFYSSQLGQFENGLTAQTILADEQGVATAKFSASPGTDGYIDIIAGTPTRSGNARFLINVMLPKTSAINSSAESNFED